MVILVTPLLSIDTMTEVCLTTLQRSRIWVFGHGPSLDPKVTEPTLLQEKLLKFWITQCSSKSYAIPLMLKPIFISSNYQF
jgi:hypothetical protein